MIVLEVIGVLAVVGIAVLLSKLLIAGFFAGVDKVSDIVSNQTTSTQRSRPYWEEYFIDPYREQINKFNQVQKTALFFTMVDVATVDGPMTSFERAFIDSFRNAIGLSQSQVESLFQNKLLTLSEEQYVLIFNGAIRSLSTEQKEWFLRVLDRMISHGPRVPTMQELMKVQSLVSDIGIAQERYKEIIDTI